MSILKQTKKVDILVECSACGKIVKGGEAEFRDMEGIFVFAFTDESHYFMEKVNVERLLKYDKIKSRKFINAELKFFCCHACYFRQKSNDLLAFFKSKPKGRGKRKLIPTIYS
jgi:hypothetical protein